MIAQVPIGISKFDNVDLNSQCDRKGPKRPKNLNPLFIYGIFNKLFDDALVKVYKNYMWSSEKSWKYFRQ